MEKDFLTSANHLLHIYFPEATGKNVLFPSIRNVFLNGSFNSAIREGFPL